MKKRITMGLLILVAWGSAFAHGWDELATLVRRNSDGTFTLDKEAHLPISTYTNALFFDYNNDGNLDLLIMGQGGDWNIPASVKMVGLYRNMGATANYRFEKIANTGFLQHRDEGFYNPLSVGDYNHDGYTDVVVMSYNNTRRIDLYLNEQGSGVFSKQSIAFEVATNGSVMFGDLNNDGWLDVEYSGYGNLSPTTLKTYINQHDGTFVDTTPALLKGAYQGQSTLADINGDGTLDILSSGNGENWSCLASLYYNTIDQNGTCSYRYVSEAESKILGASRANPLVADFNADGLMDLVVNGEPSDGSGFRNRIYYQTPKGGTFTMDKSFPVVPVNQDGGINMGDVNGDGNMDLIVGGYIGTYDKTPSTYYSSPLRVYENHPEKSGLRGNTFPESPSKVTATMDGNELVISWTPGKDKETAQQALRYNLYVHNQTTGELYTMIPVEIETGKLKVGTDLQTSLSSAIGSYRMQLFGAGVYTVGVQTLDQSYAGSLFATATLTATSINAVTAYDDFQVIRVDTGLIVRGADRHPVIIYAMDGRTVGRGVSNTVIPLSEAGAYLVSVRNHNRWYTYRASI